MKRSFSRLLRRPRFLLAFVITLGLLGGIGYILRPPSLANNARSVLASLKDGDLDDQSGLFLDGSPVSKQMAACLEANIIGPHLARFKVTEIRTIQPRPDVGSARAFLIDASGHTASIGLNTLITPTGTRTDLDMLFYKLWALDRGLSFEDPRRELVGEAVTQGIEADRAKLEACGIRRLLIRGRFQTLEDLQRELESANPR